MPRVSRWPVIFSIISCACIAERSRQGAADTTVDETQPDTTVSDGDATDGAVEADAPSPACGAEVGACLEPSAPCAEAVCLDGQCVVRQKPPASACDDSNACTGDGACQGDQCLPGAPIEDGTDCDDDGQYCTGFGQCSSGTCMFSIVGACPEIAAECVERLECSEDLMGGCAPIYSEDGTDCALGQERGECSRGTCVPKGMVLVPEGVFTMGCSAGALCPLDARPAHDVALSAYAIDRTELTEGQWRDCLRRGECQPRATEETPRVGQRADEEPLRDVSWLEASALCTSRGMRLCTEAQWERAARGDGDEVHFPWGNTLATCARAVFHDLDEGPGCGLGGPAEVGMRPDGASPFGALDMAGNVAEWVRDAYDATTYARDAPGLPQDPANDPDVPAGTSRVIRGGGWATLVDGLRVFKRDSQPVTFNDDEVGARCCWAPGDVVPPGER